MHGAMQDVLGIWARQKGGQTCGGARHVSGWGLSRGASLRGIMSKPWLKAWGRPWRVGMRGYGWDVGMDGYVSVGHQ